MNPDNLMALINDYYNDPSSYTDQEAEIIASLTRELGMPFDRERKPLKKLLYSAGEMATFGLLPDSWEPHSRGQDVYGETAIDAIASGAGDLLGLVGGGIGAYKGARGLFRKGAKSQYGQSASQAARRVRDRVGQSSPVRSVRERLSRRLDPIFSDIGTNIGYY
tara:strand:- start:668 stop:1159 length:492 start_codon:yes stop_codon:yes gene_type:complete